MAVTEKELKAAHETRVERLRAVALNYKLRRETGC
jgi:hypothetical protein